MKFQDTGTLRILFPQRRLPNGCVEWLSQNNPF